MTDNATSPAQNDESLRDQKLKLAGYSYIVGDAALATSEMIKNRAANKLLPKSEQTGFATALKGTAGGALVWGMGGVAAARYGNPDAERRLEIMALKLEKHLKAQGTTIDERTRVDSPLLQKHGIWHQCENFLYQHPSEMLNGAYAVGAGMMIRDGVKSIRAGERSLIGKNVATTFWSGALVMAGALGGLLIKEDPQAAEKAKNGGIVARTKAYFTEKSLRFPGLMYGLNNVALAGRVLQERNEFKGSTVGLKPHAFSAVTLATYVFSNLMLQFSSRDQLGNKLPAEHLAQLEDASARIIAAQPGEVQQALLGDISRYLAEQKGVGQDATQIAQALANRLTEITGERAQQAANNVSWVEREKARLDVPAPQAAL